MTIIAAIYDPETRTALVGSDTMARQSGCFYECGPKFQRVGKWMIGCAGEGRFETSIRAWAPQLGQATDAVDLANAIRKILIDEGFKTRDSPGSLQFDDIEMIFASADGIYAVDSCFAVDELPPDYFFAMGSGMHYALGAAWAVKQVRSTTHQVVMHTAISAAITYSTGCGGNVYIEQVAA